ncbi:aldehyde dehydrogenase family protein [bacterium]|nr:aldehyde dehydrogenase family protein [bacterium]
MKKFGLYINGQYIHASDYLKKDSFDPRGEAFSSEFSVLNSDNTESQELVEAAMQGASETLLQVRRGFFPLKERIEFLHTLINEIQKSEENLARVIAGEISKPLSLARGEVARSISTLEATIKEAKTFEERTLFDSPKAKGFSQRVPKGIAFAITPFNFPLNLSLHKIAPAILCGCPVLFKPSDKALLSALYLVDLIHASKLPAGMFSYLNCDNSLTTQLCQDSRISHVSFTGSAHVGWLLKQKAAGSITLELGGNAPIYIDESADLKSAAQKCAQGAFAYGGQVCISVQHVFAHKKILKEFTQLLCDETKNFPYGDVYNESTLSSQLINSDATERVSKTIQEQQASGAKIIARSENYVGETAAKTKYLSPTLLEGVDLKSNFFCSEIFGPVASLNPIDSFEDWVEFANNLENRLQCGIFSEQSTQFTEAQNSLDYGGVMINNSPMLRLDEMPYGGQGMAGLGREGPRYALEDFSTWKVVLEAK